MVHRTSRPLLIAAASALATTVLLGGAAMGQSGHNSNAPIDFDAQSIELQDREFFAAIREGREPNASVAQVLPCYQVLHDLDRQLAAG